MALNKDIMLSCGVVASYHKITSISRSYDVDRGNETNVIINQYKDKESRDSGKDSIMNEYVLIPAVFNFADAYTALKLLPQYDGAIDC